MTTGSDARRHLPAVGVLRELPEVRALADRRTASLLTPAIRHALDDVRSGAAAPPAQLAGWAPLVARHLTALAQPSLRRVLNATGVVLHTNLGRAPLAQVAIDAIAATAGGATNLEYDLGSGTRGSRYVHAVALLRELTGAEDALVLNNCAAALVVALNTTADGREAVISRGELIEIGGSFRVPDIMAKSGAILREVGTTNRTHAQDYRAALGPTTGALVKVHRSNFEQRGFVAEASVRDLAPIAAEAGVPLLHDFGSGLMMDLAPFGLAGEPTVASCLRDGPDLLVMSGDKLLGGPQAGILLGRAPWIERCRRNPLTRAFRVDKLTLAALEATLQLYRDPDLAREEIPMLAMLTTPVEELRHRAGQLRERLRAAAIAVDLVSTEATVGGGAFPTARIPSVALGLEGDPQTLDVALRHCSPAVVGRTLDGRLLLDVRAIAPRDLDDLAGAVERVAR